MHHGQILSHLSDQLDNWLIMCFKKEDLISTYNAMRLDKTFLRVNYNLQSNEDTNKKAVSCIFHLLIPQ